MKRFYDSLKCVYGPPTSGSSPMLSADGATLITDKKEIVERWEEHFSNVLNRPSSINPGILSFCFCYVNTIFGSARPGFQKEKNTFSFNCSLSQKLHLKYKSH